MNKYNIVDKRESNKKWNDDRINIHKYNETGIAELGRVYVDLPIHDKFDHSITQLPIVAKGITAFLSHTSLDSYRCIVTGFGFNKGLGLKVFFDSYYTHCLKFLRQYDRNSTSFEFEWKTEKQLAIEHLENEKKILSEPPLFYSEFYETQRSVVDNIRKAAEYYLKWVQEMYIKDDSPKNIDEDNIDAILKDMFKTINTVDLSNLKLRLYGHREFIENFSLDFIGALNKLYVHTDKLKEIGIERQDLLYVFAKHVRYKKNAYSESTERTKKQLNHKI